MKVGTIAPRTTRDKGNKSFASLAAEELQLRIEASGLRDSLASMAFDLCMEETPVEEAFQKIQETAIAKMVKLLDSTILADEGALKCCLDKVSTESERVAWQALEKGTEDLREGLALLEEFQGFENNGYLN